MGQTNLSKASKILKKIETIFWFLNFSVTMYSKIRPVLKITNAGLPVKMLKTVIFFNMWLFIFENQVFEIQISLYARKVAEKAANEAQKAADEAFENLGISRNAAETIKNRIKRTNQSEEIFLKYFGKH